MYYLVSHVSGLEYSSEAFRITAPPHGELLCDEAAPDGRAARGFIELQ